MILRNAARDAWRAWYVVYRQLQDDGNALARGLCLATAVPFIGVVFLVALVIECVRTKTPQHDAQHGGSR